MALMYYKISSFKFPMKFVSLKNERKKSQNARSANYNEHDQNQRFVLLSKTLQCAEKINPSFVW